MAAMTLLSTRGLSREFGGLHAVDNVDFDLEEGEIRAIIGPNGAGKTTFVSLVCGRVPATAGQVFFRSEDISRLPSHRRVRRGIAYTFQITSVFANLSVFDNVALAAQNSSAPPTRCWRASGFLSARRQQLRRLPTAISACLNWRWGWR
jgi:branched-chain amino acid transport system ATP-binding protein